MEFGEIYRYSEGDDNIWITGLSSGGSTQLLGVTRINGKYGILLSEISPDKGIFHRTYGGEHEYEARAILRDKDGYVLGGNSHGTATESGGYGWKAYILRVDDSGKISEEHTYSIGENAAIYSLSKTGDSITALGETRMDGREYVFLAMLDDRLEMRDFRRYGGYEEVMAGNFEKGVLSFSFRKGGTWYGKIVKPDAGTEREWETVLPGMSIYSSVHHGSHAVLLCGEMEGKAYVAEVDIGGNKTKERIFEEGVFTNMKIHNELLFLSGEIGGKPALYVLNSEFETFQSIIMSDVNGWFEDVIHPGENGFLVVGEDSDDSSALAVIVRELQ